MSKTGPKKIQDHTEYELKEEYQTFVDQLEKYQTKVGHLRSSLI